MWNILVRMGKKKNGLSFFVKMIEGRFELPPPKRPVPETGALDRSAIQPLYTN